MNTLVFALGILVLSVIAGSLFVTFVLPRLAQFIATFAVLRLLTPRTRPPRQ